MKLLAQEVFKSQAAFFHFMFCFVIYCKHPLLTTVKTAHEAERPSLKLGLSSLHTFNIKR